MYQAVLDEEVSQGSGMTLFLLIECAVREIDLPLEFLARAVVEPLERVVGIPGICTLDIPYILT